MRSLAWIGGCSLLAACGPQVELDHGGDDLGSGDESASSVDGSGTAGPSSATAPSPSTTAQPCPSGMCEDTTVPEPTITATAADTVTTAMPPPPPGGACEDHVDCPTGLCLEYSDAPPDPEAYCENPPKDGSMRVTGTVRSLSTQVAAPGAQVWVTGALDALTNPLMPDAFAYGETDGFGRVDTTSEGPAFAQIAVVALAELPGFWRSGTSIASTNEVGEAGPGPDVHDLWMVNAADVAVWNEELAGDPEAQPFLPLGDAGGFIGVVRGPDGVPRADVSVFPDDDFSAAVIRYPGAGGMLGTATTPSGIFIILGPGLGETFTVLGPEGNATGITAASAGGAIFTVGVVI